MSNVEVLDVRPDVRGGYKVDVGRGERIGRVSSEWFNRPDDERYLSLSELMASVKGRADRSRTRTVESAAVRVKATAAQALQQELDDLETAAGETGELTDEQDARAAEIEAALEALHDRPVSFEVEDVARAGAFVSIAPDGSLRIERGYVRPEDEQPLEPRLELVEEVPY